MPRDRRALAAIDLLLERGADQTAHANDRCLLEHLIGTARLLLLWHAPIDTVRAGLCHSIYGTNAFRKMTLPHSERVRLQTTIGKRAEALVWLFSRLRRPATLLRAIRCSTTLVRERCGRTRRIDADDLRQLFLLECANLLDQSASVTLVTRLESLALRHTAFGTALPHLQDLRRRMLVARCAPHTG